MILIAESGCGVVKLHDHLGNAGSDVFIPMQDAPAWLTNFAAVFPFWHFSQALQTAFNPFETGAGFEPVRLGIMAAWMAGGLVVAVRFFSWEPSR